MKMHKIAAAALACALALTGCMSDGDTAVAATYNGGEIPAGVYIYNQMVAITEASMRVGTTDLLKQTLDDTPAEQWINDRAAYYVRRFAAVELEAARLGVGPDQVALAEALKEIRAAWAEEGAAMEKSGISLASVEKMVENNELLLALFDYYYGPGGEKEVPYQELADEYAKNYRRMMAMVFSKLDDNGAVLTEGDELAAREAEIADFTARAQSGTPLFELLREQRAKTDPAAAEQLVEAEQVRVVSRSNTSYAAAFLKQLFEGDSTEPELYEDEGHAILFVRRELLEDTAHFESLRDSLTRSLRYEAFGDELAALADQNGFALNPAAVKRYKVSSLLKA